MEELFDTDDKSHEPLASRMRPRTLDEYIGQDHIVGKGRLLRRAIAADQLTSVIFYGPPGSGKTTLARVIANHTSSNFITLNAVLTGVANIREAISNAEQQRKLYNRKTILFVDEVHRWNKSQQDALLPWVENGTIILIGATTENPFFEVNKALVSRSRVFQLKPLTQEDLFNAAKQALEDKERGYGNFKIEFEEGALEHLVETANGDARSLLNALELAVETTKPEKENYIYISRETAEESIQKKVVLYDRDGDYHYDIISAFIKSLRGRDPDAACYWLARMVKAGEDPDFIFRRMLISACEDTGLADPNAITVVQNCAAAFDRVGMPEGRYFLAHAALYLSTAPKSNSSMAFFDALAAVEKEDVDVPNHLKDASRDAEGFGHGAGYLYPHAYRDHWVAQQYLPDALVGRVFFTPGTQGYEAKIHDEVMSRREVQIAAILEQQLSFTKYNSSYNMYADMHPEKGEIFSKENSSDEGMVNPISQWWMNEHFKGGSIKKEESLTFTPQNKTKEAILDKAERMWKNRIETNKAEILLHIRDTMTDMAKLVRHHRSLIWNADNGLFVFDITRKTPEGLTCGVCRSQKGLEVLEQYSSTLSDLDKPVLKYLVTGANLKNGQLSKAVSLFEDVIFDRIFLRDIIACPEDIISFAGEMNDAKKNGFLSNEIQFILCQKIPCHAQKLSTLIEEQVLPQNAFFSKEDKKEIISILAKMSSAEDEFFGDRENPLFAFDAETFAKTLTENNFAVAVQTQLLTEKRHITEAETDAWFNSESSAYGAKLALAIGDDNLNKIASLLKEACTKQLFSWKSEYMFASITFAE